MDYKKAEKANEKKAVVKAEATKAAEATKVVAKETVAAAKESVIAAVKPAVKEVGADAKAAVEKGTEKAMRVVKEKKAAKKEKEEVKPEVFVQYQGNETLLANVVEKVKEDFVAAGHRVSTIKTLQVYVKPEEFAAYYVINQKYDGKINLF